MTLEALSLLEKPRRNGASGTVQHSDLGSWGPCPGPWALEGPSLIAITWPPGACTLHVLVHTPGTGMLASSPA